MENGIGDYIDMRRYFSDNRNDSDERECPMRSRKILIRSAVEQLKKHYFINVIVAFTVGLILNGGYKYLTEWRNYRAEWDGSLGESVMLTVNIKTNADIIRDFILGNSPPSQGAAPQYTGGYFSVFFNEITSADSIAFGILNGINKIIFNEKIGESVIIFLMVIASAFVWVFVKNVITVGRCRYFLEHRIYPKTKIDRILFIYRTLTVKNVAKVMFIRTVRQFLWNFTIIGGIYKNYEYMMIPYILAENPTISAEKAFEMSKNMVKGCKSKIFVIDMIILPIQLLDGFTFHITSLFFFDPFKQCLYAEIYENLRSSENISADDAALLYDVKLFDNPGNSEIYPDEDCPTPSKIELRNLLSSDWDRRTYGGTTFILFFFFFSFIGWVFEVLFYLVNEGTFINRGTMHGPWVPIYGVGGYIIIYGLRWLRKNPPLMFVGTVAVCGSVEYFASWVLEKLFNKKWWDYTDYFLNINGRVCCEGLLVFGFMGVTMTYFIAPVAENMLNKINKKVRIVLGIVLIILFFADLAYSIKYPNIGNGITDGLI